MKTSVLLLILCSLAAPDLLGQMPDYSKDVQSAMSKISVMEGTWEGDGWTANTDGSRKTSKVVENLKFKLDNSVLLVEGKGTDEEGKVTHNALGFISFNPMSKQYSMKTFLANGMSTDADFMVLEPNKLFRWMFDTPGGVTIRYNVLLTDNKWKEEGEYSNDGEKWTKFFEMNLTKTD